MKLNNYLPIFPGSSDAKKTAPGELNNILLHAVPNVWENQYHLQEWDFEEKSYKEACKMFEFI